MCCHPGVRPPGYYYDDYDYVYEATTLQLGTSWGRDTNSFARVVLVRKSIDAIERLSLVLLLLKIRYTVYTVLFLLGSRSHRRYIFSFFREVSVSTVPLHTMGEPGS